jgi:ribosomal protein S18 acetylase RimI-like enzyme
VIARAFVHDPLLVHLLPTEEARERLMTGHLSGLVRRYALGGEAWRTGDLAGVACWVAPGRDLPAGGPPGEQRARLVAAVGTAVAEAFDAVGAHAYEQRRSLGLPPHWYLAFLAVEPEHQGRGVGSALVAPVLARAEAAGETCVLETFVERNVRFYERLGFAVRAECTAPVAGLTYWLMTRGPVA